MTRLLWLSPVILGLACGGEPRAPLAGEAEAEPAVPETAAVRAEPAVAPEQVAAPPPEEAVAEQEEESAETESPEAHSPEGESSGAESPEANPAEDIDALADAVGVALEAAGEAEVGAETCAVAYESMAAAAAAIEARLPGSTNPLPAKPLFLTACRRFPEPAQQCLITRYAVAHAEECLAIQAAVPEDVRRGLERLLAGPE